MTFYDVLEQVIELLHRHRRVTYRALKRQFELDDAYIEDLKVEIVKARQVAVDQDGEMLVWTGEAGRQSEPASTAMPREESDVRQDVQPIQIQPPPQLTPRDAERRQLTVMFSDLVDSTTLSGQLDPEDYREVLRAYHATCAEVIHRFDGYIAQHLGDALLVYFGFPQAHENDAQRGILAGLGMLEAMKTLNTRLQHEKDLRLAIRVGMHTGMTIVGDVGSGPKQELLALGEAPNVASRIQGIAAPDTVAISADTFQLIEGYFTCQDLDEHRLKGVVKPMRVYRVLQQSGAQSRLDIAHARGLTPLVGREQEVGLLLERWEHVKEGQGQVVLLSGEAGIGKSRLVQVIKDQVAGEAHTRLECRSSPYYQNTALYPITDVLQRMLQWQPDDTPEAKLRKLERGLSPYSLAREETIPLLASLLALSLPEDRYPALTLPPRRQRQKTLEAVVALVFEQAAHHPVLFTLEDLHWTDPSTLEWLDLLINQAPTAPILTILTCRPAFKPPWGLRTHLTQMALHRFTRPQVEQMVQRVTDGKALPAEVMRQLVEKTDGVPLYVEEMTKALVESESLTEANGRYEFRGSLSSLAIPATLQDSLTARLDRLGTAKGVAQIGATIGRQFPYALLQAVSQRDHAILQRELARLLDAELLYQRGQAPQATYTFKHALIQDAAYQSLLKSTCQQYHQRIAQALETQFPATAETQPELLAYHYTEANLSTQAVSYWQQAGQRAGQRSAYAEAITHLTKGLELLPTLPDTAKRVQQELTLRLTLGVTLTATKGVAAPEVENAYLRARELCEQLGEPSQLFQVLQGLGGVYVLRAELQKGRELGEQLLSLAQQGRDPTLLLEAYHLQWCVWFYLGEFTSNQACLEQGLTLYDSQKHRSHALQHYGHDPGVCCLAHKTFTLWALGHPDQALQSTDEMLHLARELSHPHSLALALAWAARLHQLRREPQQGHELAEAAVSLSTAQGFARPLAEGMLMRGWALVEQGQGAEGMTQMRQGLDAYRATAAELWQPYFLALLAEACGKRGQAQQGRHLVDQALVAVGQTGERVWEAELFRLKGEHLRNPECRVPGSEWTPDACFQQALAIARSQHAKSWELRAATSLARLWQLQDKRKEAYDLLAPVYDWFTEGFDTADLKDVKALLDELS